MHYKLFIAQTVGVEKEFTPPTDVGSCFYKFYCIGENILCIR